MILLSLECCLWNMERKPPCVEFIFRWSVFCLFFSVVFWLVFSWLGGGAVCHSVSFDCTYTYCWGLRVVILKISVLVDLAAVMVTVETANVVYSAAKQAFTVLKKEFGQQSAFLRHAMSQWFDGAHAVTSFPHKNREHQNVCYLDEDFHLWSICGCFCSVPSPCSMQQRSTIKKYQN